MAYSVPANDPKLEAIKPNDNTNADVASISALKDIRWMLDGVGNWVGQQSADEQGSSALGYQSNPMNEYDKIGPIAQSHDAQGNLTTDGNRHYLYDALNRLVRVTTLSGNTLANYNYDAFGRRTHKVAQSQVTLFHYFGKQVMEERNIQGQVQRQFVYGQGIDEVLQMRTGAKDYYYHDNRSGICCCPNG